ncbi:hypothetical protein GCM10008915_36250 [Bifidobacterium pullorum subsp. gallinarum]
MILMTWGMFKGQKGTITEKSGNKNLVIKLESGVEIHASVDHVEEMSSEKLVVVRVGSGNKTHIAKVFDTGFLSVGCGAVRMSGAHTREIYNVVTSDRVTCAKCRERYGI